MELHCREYDLSEHGHQALRAKEKELSRTCNHSPKQSSRSNVTREIKLPELKQPTVQQRLRYPPCYPGNHFLYQDAKSSILEKMFWPDSVWSIFDECSMERCKMLCIPSSILVHCIPLHCKCGHYWHTPVPPYARTRTHPPTGRHLPHRACGSNMACLTTSPKQGASPFGITPD